MSSLVMIEVVRLIATAGLPFLLRFFHAHALLMMFLSGVLAGQVVLGSNFTGRGWFRSHDGLTYEGFKLEEIKPWIWLLVSPVFALGVIAWFQEQRGPGTLSSLSFVNFYHDVLMPNCSLSWWKNYPLYPFCGVQLIFVGTWIAAIGYSLAPLVRRSGSKLLRTMQPSPTDREQ
jgi:hypothetical protein